MDRTRCVSTGAVSASHVPVASFVVFSLPFSSTSSCLDTLSMYCLMLDFGFNPHGNDRYLFTRKRSSIKRGKSRVS